MKTGVRINLFIPKDKITDDDVLSVIQSLGSTGYFTFTPDSLKKDVEDAMKNRKIAIDETGKSKSAILRGYLFKYWNRFYKGGKSWEEFYNAKMDGIIGMTKQTIEKLEIEDMDEAHNKHGK